MTSHLNRRAWVARTFSSAASIAAMGMGGRFASAAADLADNETSAADLITPDTQRAIDAGLRYLAERQQEDGSFGPAGYSRNIAVCSLAGMALMSAGNTPGRGMYGGNVDRLLDFVMSTSHESGFISLASSASHGPMYDHGFATLFLAETYGMSMRGDIRDKLSKAVSLIVQTQNREGGWRYQPQRRDADISVTICQVMALRAARNAGLYVPADTIDRCIKYVKECQNSDGGFMYMLQGGQSAFPRSAAGIVALFSAGVYDSPEVRKGLDYLMRFIPRGAGSRDGHYFYGHYYAVQAFWHVGGASWNRWYPAIRDELLANQRPDGSWLDSICSEYGTAMACIILQMPNNYLPIFQR